MPPMIPDSVQEAVEQLDAACEAFLYAVPDDYEPSPDDGDLSSLRTLVRNAQAGTQRWRDRLAEIAAEAPPADADAEEATE